MKDILSLLEQKEEAKIKEEINELEPSPDPTSETGSPTTQAIYYQPYSLLKITLPWFHKMGGRLDSRNSPLYCLVHRSFPQIDIFDLVLNHYTDAFSMKISNEHLL